MTHCLSNLIFILAGHFTFGGKSYWISWASDETTLRNARWNWFTGRNYCRKMCMDMVSFESRAEQNFVEGLMKASNVDNVHSAGRLCDAEVEGCDAPRFQPLNINGWFWASTLRMMPPTNLRSNNVVSVCVFLKTNYGLQNLCEVWTILSTPFGTWLVK